MKAMLLHEIGGPDKLSYEDAPDPEPGSGETVVRLHAAALNRRDVFVTRGQYPGAKPEALPVILGSDGSGEVVATVFASRADSNNSGYGIPSQLVGRLLAAAGGRTDPVSTGGCVN